MNPGERSVAGGAAVAPRSKRGHLVTANRFDLAGSALAGLSIAWLCGQLTTFSGAFGFLVVSYVVFLATYMVLVSLRADGPAVVDAAMTVLLCSAAVIALGALAAVVGFTLWKGHDALVHSNFYLHDMSTVDAKSPLTVGGVGHALVGTVLEVGIAVVLTVPIGLVTAVYLDQTNSRPARFVRTIVQAMTALPTILAGLFIYALFILTLGFQKSGLAAGLALGVMMLPYLIRTAEIVLLLVPESLREASAALGAPRWRTVWNVVLPTARPGLATAIILAIARGIGETAPVLLTAGFTTYINANPFQGPMVSLPLEALKLVSSGEPGLVVRGFACAAFLLLVVLVLFVTARVVGGWGPGHLSARQQRRVDRRSARDLSRLSRRPAPSLAFGSNGTEILP